MAAVAAPHRQAEEAGLAVLALGGNALEAAVAVAATLCTVYPHMTGLGGDGFWLVAEPGKAPMGIQACGPAAQAATPAWYRSRGFESVPTRGPAAALTVAGAVPGWSKALELSRRWGGSLPLAVLLADARRLSLQAITVSRSQAELTRAKWDELSPLPGFAATFAPSGPPEKGSVLTLPRLADVWDRLAVAGLDDFYRGDLGQSLGADLASLGSPLTTADLSRFEARFVEPLSVDLSVGTVYNLPPPTQGVSSLAILALFDRLGITQPEGVAHVHGLVEATKKAFAWRNAHVGDPARMTAHPRDFLQPAHLAQLATTIDPAQASPWPQPAAAGDTVWFGVVDDQGRCVSVIQSLYWEFGAGLVLPQTGLLWQNRGSSFSLTPGPNQLEGGRLPFHTLNPALARLKAGPHGPARTVAYGTMGGEGQPQTQAAFLTRYAWFGQPLAAALDAPRWLLGRTWGEDTFSLRLENRFDSALATTLATAGHAVEVVAAYDDRMGHAGAVVCHEDGRHEAAHDPRADGGGMASPTDPDSWQLRQFLSHLATFGADQGGVTRLLYNKAWVEARAWLAAEFSRLGFEVRDDRVGNLYGRVSGTDAQPKPTAPLKSSGRSEDGVWQASDDTKTGAYPSVREDLSESEAPPKPTAVVLTGSHFDTVRRGGWYDGAYGVAASAVALAGLVRRHGPPRRTVEVVAFAEEEGSRFPLTYWGSGNLAGRWPHPQATAGEQKDSEGITLADAAALAGFGNPDQADPRRNDLAAFVELHIEQGIVMERSGDQIGVVSAIVGQRRWLVKVQGQANHAGTTPMGLRHDALAGAVEMMALVESEARRRGDPLVATVGFVEVAPNTPNVVPGTVNFTVDARHTDAQKLAAFCSFLEVTFGEIATRRGLVHTTEPRMTVPPAAMDDSLQGLIRQACDRRGFTHKTLPSGAGHDAQVLSQLCPTAMIFVPSRGGISHSPLEFSSHQALSDGLAVLSDLLYDLAWKGAAP